jgi:hypothetical protein
LSTLRMRLDVVHVKTVLQVFTTSLAFTAT